MPPQSTVGETFSQDLVKRYDQWWTVRQDSLEYGGLDIKDSGIGYAIIDTGTSLLYLGQEDYFNFIEQMLKDVPEGLDCTSTIYCFSDTLTCDELSPFLKPLMIQLQDNYYTLPASAYTFDRGVSFQKKCTVGVSYTESTGGVFILGDTFLRNFVTTFDYKNRQIKLAANVYAPEDIVIEYRMDGWKIFGIILACLCGLAMIIWAIVYCCKRSKKNKISMAYSML